MNLVSLNQHHPTGRLDGGLAAPSILLGAQSLFGRSTLRLLDQSTATSAGTTAPADIMDMEARLMQHEQTMLDSIQRDTAEATRLRTDELIDAQLQKAWQEDRERWRKECLGPRSSAASNQPLSVLAATNASGIIARRMDGNELLLPSSSTSMSLQPLAWPLHHFQPPQTPFDVAQAQAHLAILQRTEQMDHSMAVEFCALTASSSSTTTGKSSSKQSPVESGYHAAWQLVKHLLGTTSRRQVLSPVDQAIAALSHLCLQFQSVVIDRNRQATLAGENTSSAATTNVNYYSHDFANQCAAFTKLSMGLHSSSSSAAQHWPVLYYCLRSGHAVAALQVYEQSPQPHEAVLLKVLTDMAHTQGSAPSIWCKQASGPPYISDSETRMICDMSYASQHREPPSGLHEQGVYALLSGSTLPTDSSLAGFSLIEDFLTGALWKALLDDNPEAQLVLLGQRLRELGPDHFGDPYSGGWSFAWPLLLTQQYERALTYLTEAGGPTGLLQATHLALALGAAAGADLGDLGRDSALSDFSKSGGLVTCFLVSYAKLFLGQDKLGPRVAMEYLVRIPGHRQAYHEMAKLISTTGELQLLVGGVNENGVRIKGGTVMDLHFSPTAVAQVLIEAAELLLSDHQKNNERIGLAAMCYMLAERYADVLSLLNQLICPPEQPDDQRSFWLGQLDEFGSRYLSTRTHVVQVLEKHNNMSLVETSRTLVELNAFFLHLKDGRHEQAWAIVDRLHLLPKTRTDLPAKENAYYDLDPLVQKAFPALLVGAMEMLQAEHHRLKLERQSSALDVTKERLKQIQERGKLLVTLAGLVGLVSEHSNRLSRLESLLI
jgi:hypothetical protein